jgi:heme exporter protein B
VRGAIAVLAKDLRIEWRTKEGVSAAFVLGVLLLVVLTVAHDAPAEAAPGLVPPVLWASFLFTGLLGVQRGFLLERESDCLAGLLAAPIDPGDVYLGKLGANVVLLAVMQAIVVPLSGLFLHVDLVPVLPGLLLVLLLGNLGFAALATLFAAVAVRTRAREVMLPILLLPLLVPLLVLAATATRDVLAAGIAEARFALQVLAAFDVVFGVAGWLLFEYVVRD